MMALVPTHSNENQMANGTGNQRETPKRLLLALLPGHLDTKGLVRVCVRACRPSIISHTASHSFSQKYHASGAAQCCQVPRLPRKVKVECRQAPRLPHKVKVDVAKCHACHTTAAASTATNGKCHACHTKCRTMTTAAQSESRCHQATPATPIAAASTATNGNHQSQPIAISATLATQSAGRCRQVPRLPCKVKADATKHHACHTNSGGDNGDNQAPQPNAISATLATQSAGRVWELRVRKLCVWESCVCVRELCVCERVVCERLVCVWERVVCERVVCERVVCERLVCERLVCERELCVWNVWTEVKFCGFIILIIWIL